MLQEKCEAMQEAHTSFQEHVHKPLADLESDFRAILEPNAPVKDVPPA